jgi:hypothetical protein
VVTGTVQLKWINCHPLSEIVVWLWETRKCLAENPQKLHNRVPLETFVQNVYLDVTDGLIDDRPMSIMLCNLSTLAPILSNIRSLYVKMACHKILAQYSFLPVLADWIHPLLSKLTIKVTVSYVFST